MTVARKLAVTAVLAAVLALFMSMTAKPAPGLGQARLTSYATAQQPAAAANITVSRTCTTGSASGNVPPCLTTYPNGPFVEQIQPNARLKSSARPPVVGIGGPHPALGENP